MYACIRRQITIVPCVVITGMFLALICPTPGTHAAAPPSQAAVQSLLKEVAAAIEPCMRARTALLADLQASSPHRAGTAASRKRDDARTHHDATRMVASCSHAVTALHGLTISPSLRSDPATRHFESASAHYAATSLDFARKVEQISGSHAGNKGRDRSTTHRPGQQNSPASTLTSLSPIPLNEPLPPIPVNPTSPPIIINPSITVNVVSPSTAANPVPLTISRSQEPMPQAPVTQAPVPAPAPQAPVPAPAPQAPVPQTPTPAPASQAPIATPAPPRSLAPVPTTASPPPAPTLPAPTPASPTPAATPASQVPALTPASPTPAPTPLTPVPQPPTPTSTPQAPAPPPVSPAPTASATLPPGTNLSALSAAAQQQMAIALQGLPVWAAQEVLNAIEALPPDNAAAAIDLFAQFTAQPGADEVFVTILSSLPPDEQQSFVNGLFVVDYADEQFAQSVLAQAQAAIMPEDFTM